MAISTYDKLIEQARIDANRGVSVLTDEVMAQRVADAEAKILRRLNVETQMSVDERTADGALLSLPASYKAAFDLYAHIPDSETGEDGEPFPIQIESMQKHLRRTWGTSGRPRAAAEWQNEFNEPALHLWPTPDGDYNYVLRYYSIPDGLSQFQQQTSMFIRYPDVYLWGTLVEIQYFLQDEQALAIAKSNFEEIIASIEMEQDDRELSGSEPTINSGYSQSEDHSFYY